MLPLCKKEHVHSITVFLLCAHSNLSRAQIFKAGSLNYLIFGAFDRFYKRGMKIDFVKKFCVSKIRKDGDWSQDIEIKSEFG